METLSTFNASEFLTVGRDSNEFNGMTVFPLFITKMPEHQYLTLRKAIAENVIIISEVTQGGSVPQLLVINKSDLPILLLDGEELKGAKQNRVLNTSILLKEHSETVIPVSCTESGRWQYTKPIFEESGEMMHSSARHLKMESVSLNLNLNMGFSSDQSQVWDEISCMSRSLGSKSNTSAMNDIYVDKQAELQEFVQHFPKQENQYGILVAFGDKVVGLDIVSLPSAWDDFHEKLIRSYALDMLSHPVSGKTCNPGQAEEFIKSVICPANQFPSLGYGNDLRLQGQGFIGSALLWKDILIHLECYAQNSKMQDSEYYSPRRRMI